MYERKDLSSLLKRLKEPRKFIQVLSGPRQIGKTTIAEQLIKKISMPYSFFSADGIPSADSLWINQIWESARLKMDSANDKGYLLIIDEIQKISNWSEYIKRNWDMDSRKGINLKLLILGSSNMLLNKGLTESLTGRFELIKLSHWSFTEMKNAFDFNAEEYAYFGGYPGAACLIKNEKRWKDYIINSIVETTISKDILQTVHIQKPALLKNLFELSCKYAGEILSYTKILGQLNDAGNTTTLAHYQELLDKSWMIKGLQKFSKSKVSTRSSIPKWLAYNTSFASVYSQIGFKETKKNPALWGRRVEQAIGAYLLNQTHICGFNLFYWRDGNKEVDFILKKDNKIVALEVKASNLKFHKGLNEFNKKYKVDKNILISNESFSWMDMLNIDISKLFS
ncbi:MAG: ATP-binding protein [Elusimicrobia bacterium]|nr:ATP-binding protein [Elusimicrobiota bacterium]